MAKEPLVERNEVLAQREVLRIVFVEGKVKEDCGLQHFMHCLLPESHVKIRLTFLQT